MTKSSFTTAAVACTAYRSISRICPTRVVREGGGFLVRRPSSLSDLSSPFLLLDEFGPVTYGPREAKGAPWHPHRGFETVSYIIDGTFCHQDSSGKKGSTGPGGVQWMTAGRGVIHDERPSPELFENGGKIHGFQIWVNLPAASKMIQPRYQEVAASESPVVEKDGVWARVIAGTFLNTSSNIDTIIPITLIHVKMEKGSTAIKEMEDDLNCMIYMMKGKVSLGKSENSELSDASEHSLVILSKEGHIDLQAIYDDCEFLIMAGPEIGEPIARYGPFVMNTKEEIIQAFKDYEDGTFLDHPFEIPQN